MDYREIFRKALDSYEIEKKKVDVAINDIIDINNIRYLVLHKYGKFHKLLNMDDGYEHLINLEKKDIIIVISNKLKHQIHTYVKPEFNLERYYRNRYLTFKEYFY